MRRVIILWATILLSVLCSVAKQPERGYRGFAEWTNRLYRESNREWSRTYYLPGISTSHGYQLNSWLFTGIGIDYSFQDSSYFTIDEEGTTHRHLKYDPYNYMLSIFGQARTDLHLGRFTPFADVRLGWNATSQGTVYFSTSIGYRFNWGRKTGINIGIGYTLDAYRYEHHILGTTVDGLTIAIPSGKYFNWNQSSFTFRIGVDF